MAVTLDRDISLPPFTDKDIQAFHLAKELGIKHAALSFAHQAEDIERLREIMGPDVHLISKIECKKALENLDEIIDASDSILIDRGDMSREVSIERIPRLQKEIIGDGAVTSGYRSQMS